jgi:hypothetical protein
MKTTPRVALIIAVLALAAVAPGRLAAQAVAPDTILLKGPSFGGVKFVHAKHVDVAECAVCHHSPRPEMPASDEFAKCKSCHTEVVEPPMVTNGRDAFHDRRAREGLCVGCHTTEAAAGKATPARCTTCHKADD